MKIINDWISSSISLKQMEKISTFWVHWDAICIESEVQLPKKKNKKIKTSINSLNIFFQCFTCNMECETAKVLLCSRRDSFFPLSPSVLSKIASPSLCIPWVLCSGSLNRPARLRTSGIISRDQPDINHSTLTSVQVITFYMTLHAKQTAVTTCRKVQWRERDS